MPHRAAVLFANEAFYRAFADRNMEAMKNAWSELSPLSCIHPGWHPLTDREDVMDTWDAILSNPETPEIECLNPEVLMHGDVAIITCYERVMGQYLTATNVLVKEDNRWKMVHHQAGPATMPPDDDVDGLEGGGEVPMN